MTHLTNEQRMLLILLRRGLWNEDCEVPARVDWEIVDQMAKEQGVISLVYDGARQINMNIPPEILGKWKKKMLQGVGHNEQLLAAQGEVVTQLEKAGVSSVILKGSSVARYYPQPALRVLGDTDILVRKGDLEAAKEVLGNLGYCMHESDHSFHIGFRKGKSYVELHYGVTDFPDSPGGEAAAKIAEGFLEKTAFGGIDSHRFPVLTEENQALSLLLHMIRHMFDHSIGLRQLCDWLMYVSCQEPEVFQRETLPVLEQCGLLEYAKAATKVCVQHLGLDEKHRIWCADAEDKVCHAFLMDIFRGGNMGQADKESMGGLFTDHKHMGERDSALGSLLLYLTDLVYKQFPWVKRCRILLPFFWLFLPVRYWIRSLLGLRPKKNVNNVLSSAVRSRQLYDQLKVFELNGTREPADGTVDTIVL